MKTTLISLLFLGLISCTTTQNQLADHKTFTQTFTPAEIQDLQRLFDFFNQHICPGHPAANPADCYTGFFRRMEPAAETGIIQPGIPFEKQKALYQELSEEAFGEIWSLREVRTPEDGYQEPYRYLRLNLSGKFVDFLRETGKDDPVIKSYCETVEATGGLAPSLVADLLTNYSTWNIHDIRVRFIIAIHYLTVNDQMEREEIVGEGG